MEIIFREAAPSDSVGISEVVRGAFPGSPGEVIDQLVSDLLVDPTAQPLISLVAETDSRIVGHILFTRVTVTDSPRSVTANILAPLSVDPANQRQGVGGGLIQAGLARSRQGGVDLVFVLGHPGYYPRHGFVVAGENEFKSPYEIPVRHAEAWMVQGLSEGAVEASRGRVVCANSLMDPKHWRE